MRRTHRRDGNHDAVCAALRAHGWQIVSLVNVGGGVPDVLAYRADHQLRLFEVKPMKGKLRASQTAFQQDGWPVTVLRTVDDVIAVSRR